MMMRAFPGWLAMVAFLFTACGADKGNDLPFFDTGADTDPDTAGDGVTDSPADSPTDPCT